MLFEHIGSVAPVRPCTEGLQSAVLGVHCAHESLVDGSILTCRLCKHWQTLHDLRAATSVKEGLYKLRQEGMAQPCLTCHTSPCSLPVRPAFAGARSPSLLPYFLLCIKYQPHAGPIQARKTSFATWDARSFRYFTRACFMSKQRELAEPQRQVL